MKTTLYRLLYGAHANHISVDTVYGGVEIIETDSGIVAGAPDGTVVQLYGTEGTFSGSAALATSANAGTRKSSLPSGYTYMATSTTNAAGYYYLSNLPPGVYIVILIMEGHESTASNPITLGNGDSAENVNFTVKGGNITPDAVTGTGEIWNIDLKIYPNPFTGEVYITGVVETLRAMSLRITNASGAIVHTQTITNPDEIIHLEHLPAGVYFFVFEKDETVKTVKVVKIP